MLASYALIVRRSAAVTAAVAAVMVAVSAAVAGGKGVLGALLGTLLVAVFFAISVLAVGAAARVSAQAMMLTAIGTYVVKILVLLIFVSRFSGTTAFSPRMFGLTALACILAWSGAQVAWSMKLKVQYVEPDGDPVRVAGPEGKR
jgi:ATP synthase protein I